MPPINSGLIPNRSAALEQYGRRAKLYDCELALFEHVRILAIAELHLAFGQTVFDIGCGTGLSLHLLRKAVGAKGRVIGIEQSPQMIEQAHCRVTEHGWQNVDLICAPVAEAAIGSTGHAALFHFTHDILRENSAIANVVNHLKPGARVVASGLKWASLWALPVNLFVWPVALYSVTTLEGMTEPWSKLETFSDGLQVESMHGGGIYVASGAVTA
jgi:SAM-dependent methyltransferase